MTTTRQIEMDFQAGLTQQYRDIVELMNSVVYGSRQGLGGVAAQLDLTPSMLSRMLNKPADPDDQRHLRARDLEKIIEITGDRRPIHYLIEKFCEDKDAQRERALARLPQLVQEIEATLRVLRGKK